MASSDAFLVDWTEVQHDHGPIVRYRQASNGNYHCDADDWKVYQYSNSIETTSPRFQRPGQFFVYLVFVKAMILVRCSQYTPSISVVPQILYRPSSQAQA